MTYKNQKTLAEGKTAIERKLQKWLWIEDLTTFS